MSDSVRPHRRQPTRLPHPWDSPGKNTGVGCHFLLQCVKVKSESEVAQSCLTLIDPMDCSLPDSSIHGIFQARVLEWGAIAFSGFRLEFSANRVHVIPQGATWWQKCSFKPCWFTNLFQEKHALSLLCFFCFFFVCFFNENVDCNASQVVARSQSQTRRSVCVHAHTYRELNRSLQVPITRLK